MELIDQINHSPSITTEDYAYEIKGAGLFSRNLLFSLRSPVPVKAGEQVRLSNFYHFLFIAPVIVAPNMHPKSYFEGKKIL